MPHSIAHVLRRSGLGNFVDFVLCDSPEALLGGFHVALLEEATNIPGKADGPSLAIVGHDLRKSTAAWALSRDCHYGFDPGGVSDRRS